MFQAYSFRGKKDIPGDFLLVVAGEAEVVVAPNLASIHLGVISEGKTVLQAQQENATVITKVIQSLTKFAISKNQLQTFDYRVDSEYDFENGKQIFLGYKVTHLLQIKIDDLNRIGEVIDTAVQHGANYVANVQFMSKNNESIYQQALTAAVKNAVQKATAISAALKVHVNPVPIAVKETGTAGSPVITQPGSYVKGAVSTQIEPGQLIIKAAVTAKFFYKI
ncbi:SIMPL domain-containing protein [Neobacillus sp. SM06]|uniref:SIMPL domain-containing protein n=1 Tax=Neobacillus sp. SM06 TaxID=3422492 RepID=UPI003D2CD64B